MSIPANATDIVKTNTLEYWKIPGQSILYGRVFDGAILDKEQVEENEVARRPLLDFDVPIPYILDISKIDKITKEGRTLSSQLTEGFSAIALIVGSGLSKVMGNYALMLNRPKVPLKLFTSLDEARIWVRDYMPKN